MPGFSGLSLLDTVRQSAAIHPHWDAKQHMAYLIDEAGYSEIEVLASHEVIVHEILSLRG